MAKSISSSLVDAHRLVEAALGELEPLRGRKFDGRHNAALVSLYETTVSFKRLAERLLGESHGMRSDEGRGQRHISGLSNRKSIRDDEAGLDPLDYRERRSGDVANE